MAITFTKKNKLSKNLTVTQNIEMREFSHKLVAIEAVTVHIFIGNFETNPITPYSTYFGLYGLIIGYVLSKFVRHVSFIQ